MKTLLLCADDFGLNPAIDRGILALARQGRLTAVSCLVGGPGWADGAAALVATGVRCGLHLNLTEGRPLSAALAAHWPVLPSLPRLLLMAHLQCLPPQSHPQRLAQKMRSWRLPVQAIAGELALQLQAFEAAAGRPPRHLDGHQHVHHLPGVRQAVLALLAQRPGLQVRNTGHVDAPGWWLKGQVIAGSGGRALSRQLLAQGGVHGRAQGQAQDRAQNRRLLGVHGFGPEPYRPLMQAWLARLPASGGLIFCHPAAPAVPGDRVTADPIAASREREFAYLSGTDFSDDMTTAGVSLQTSSAG